MPRVSPDMQRRLDALGLRVASCWQMVRPNNRKLPQIATADDPYMVVLYLPDPDAPLAAWAARSTMNGVGDSPDSAVEEALSSFGGVRLACLVLAQEMGRLASAIQTLS